MTRPKEINFSEARQKLSAIVDEVEKTGTPVKILRHGKVAAVVIGDLEYQHKFEKKKKKWKLAGSLIPVKGVDLEKALDELDQKNIKAHQSWLEKAKKEFLDD